GGVGEVRTGPLFPLAAASTALVEPGRERYFVAGGGQWRGLCTGGGRIYSTSLRCLASGCLVANYCRLGHWPNGRTPNLDYPCRRDLRSRAALAPAQTLGI